MTKHPKSTKQCDINQLKELIAQYSQEDLIDTFAKLATESPKPSDQAFYLVLHDFLIQQQAKDSPTNP
ncbi:hypothetical protein I6N95_23205 [Vagococcus sp. BWB3-3]|uniref:Uncharacterized protein n=1 Tax=Vagococcus allomyrinae TaxID=2794353 RepID=A0A940PI00_9ENTE|nr:hypothetical protein [Vagococcus allomyrinae]MBP1043941.1 hypothetical protein [Vagococcus allomyrinae]